MRGQNFAHLKMCGGTLCIDEDSEAYKSMLPKKYQEPRVDDAGRIVLPGGVRKGLKNTDLVEYWMVSNEQYVISVTKAAPISRVE